MVPLGKSEKIRAGSPFPPPPRPQTEQRSRTCISLHSWKLDARELGSRVGQGGGTGRAKLKPRTGKSAKAGEACLKVPGGCVAGSYPDWRGLGPCESCGFRAGLCRVWLLGSGEASWGLGRVRKAPPIMAETPNYLSQKIWPASVSSSGSTDGS